MFELSFCVIFTELGWFALNPVACACEFEMTIKLSDGSSVTQQPSINHIIKSCKADSIPFADVATIAPLIVSGLKPN